MRVIRIEQMPIAGRHDRHVVAQRDELLVEGIHRIRIVEFAGRVDRRMVGIDGDPWLLSSIRRSETGIDRAVPLHRGTRIITTARGDTRQHRFGRLHFGFLNPLTVSVQGLEVTVLV